MLAKPPLDRPLASLWVVVGSHVFGSLYMAAADRRAARTDGRDLLGLTDSMLIGGSQILALLLPGFSRSGAGISTGWFLGLDRIRATRLSFLFSVPALVGAGVFELEDASAAGGAGALVIGVAVAFVVSFVSIAWLLRFVATHSFTGFVQYRVVLAAALRRSPREPLLPEVQVAARPRPIVTFIRFGSGPSGNAEERDARPRR